MVDTGPQASSTGPRGHARSLARPKDARPADISSLDQVISELKSRGGDAIRKEYEDACAANQA